MTFFQQFTAVQVAQPEPEPVRPAWFQPETQLPGVVAVELILARTDAAAVLLSGVRVYRTGLAFSLDMVLRQPERRGPRPFRSLDPDGIDGEPLAPEFLRFGVRYPDGRAVSNLPRTSLPVDSEPDSAEPLLMRHHGGGGNRRYSMEYWLWPLPPPGPLTFVCEWPARGIRETSVVLDGELVQAAAQRCVELWPTDGSG